MAYPILYHTLACPVSYPSRSYPGPRLVFLAYPAFRAPCCPWVQLKHPTAFEWATAPFVDFVVTYLTSEAWTMDQRRRPEQFIIRVGGHCGTDAGADTVVVAAAVAVVVAAVAPVAVAYASVVVCKCHVCMPAYWLVSPSLRCACCCPPPPHAHQALLFLKKCVEQNEYYSASTRLGPEGLRCMDHLLPPDRVRGCGHISPHVLAGSSASGMSVSGPGFFPVSSSLPCTAAYARPGILCVRGLAEVCVCRRWL
jgi:hypothetical protein